MPEDLRANLADVVRDLRLGCEGAAGSALAHFLVGLHGWLSQPRPGPSTQALLPLLGSLLEAQERADVLALADRLEYELAPLLPAPQAPARGTP